MTCRKSHQCHHLGLSEREAICIQKSQVSASVRQVCTSRSSPEANQHLTRNRSSGEDGLLSAVGLKNRKGSDSGRFVWRSLRARGILIDWTGRSWKCPDGQEGSLVTLSHFNEFYFKTGIHVVTRADLEHTLHPKQALNLAILLPLLPE